MEHGEDFGQAVRREVREEYGCEPLDVHFIEARNVIRNNNGTKTNRLALLFAVRVDPNQTKNNEPEKIDEIGWFFPDKLPSPLHSMFG